MATAAAAVVAKARRAVASHFLDHRAVSADSAVTFAPEHHIVRRQFERLQARGVIREAEPGTYWIDVAAYEADRNRRRKLVLFVVAFAAAVAAAVAAATLRG
ncbi:MAG: hypothetical protein V4574_19910 [Pseudomonadota bacterium]